METDIKKELLPIGSVVLLEGAKKKVMVIGIFPFDAEKQDKIYDYMGVLYPEGFLGKGSACMFDHDRIAEVFFRGYENDERESFLNIIQKVYDETEKNVIGTNKQ
ncbi:MAG: DUF4176 domain-containing protein [Lachnospiraceae bacterium]|nr:DUF4176 domain-containing protein [Lachnospiraceae bacterium]